MIITINYLFCHIDISLTKIAGTVEVEVIVRVFLNQNENRFELFVRKRSCKKIDYLSVWLFSSF